MPRLIKLLSACIVLTSIALSAESKNPADYPFRIHIFNKNETNFYHARIMEEAKGEGRANLFANGDVHGIDFSFACDQKLKPSFGYETYPAKWKKPGQELVVLLPVFGKTGSYFTCNFKTDVKDYAYAAGNGRLNSESPEQFKKWMVNHDYDPEHGKNQPINLNRQPVPAQAPPAQ